MFFKLTVIINSKDFYLTYHIWGNGDSPYTTSIIFQRILITKMGSWFRVGLTYDFSDGHKIQSMEMSPKKLPKVKSYSSGNGRCDTGEGGFTTSSWRLVFHWPWNLCIVLYHVSLSKKLFEPYTLTILTFLFIN